MNLPQEPNKKKLILIGYPNAGKTTLFNSLCKKRAKIVNYPGSTVSLNVANLDKYTIVDSPGTRSLNPDSPDEEVSVKELENADGIILVLNGTRLLTQLSLTFDLLKKQIPMTIIITRYDQNIKIDLAKLSETLGLNVFYVNAKKPNLTIDDIDKSIKIPNQSLFNSLKEFKNQVLLSLNSEELLDKKEDKNNHQEKINTPKNLFFDLDVIFLNPFFGPIVFIAVMSLFFYSIYTLASPLIDAVDSFFALTGEYFHQIFPQNFLSSLFIDGLWLGIGAVLVFTPQILILFFALGILEQSGYLVRAAMIVDKPLSKIGLNGRSFVPLLSGCACAIPALLATRNITDKKVRLVCQFVIPLMQCSARLPVYGLLLGVLFINQPWMSSFALTLIYLSSFFIAAIVAGITSKVLKINETDNTFALEIPSFKKPDLGLILIQSYKQTLHFIKRAGPIITVLSIFIWITSNYPNPNNSFAMMIGKVLEPIFLPMGIDWRVGVALLLSFIAREVFVSVLAIMFMITNPGGDISNSMISAISSATFENTNNLIFTTPTSIGLIVFFMISLQCMATLATARSEIGNWKIPLLQFVSYVSLAYFLAVLIQQVSRLFI